MDKQNCVLCLRTTMDIFPLLEDDLLVILYDFLQKSIQTISSQQNMVCSECRDNLQMFYNFKMAYGDISAETFPVDDSECEADMNQEDIKNKQVVEYNRSIEYVKNRITCRFCSRSIINLCAVPLNDVKKSTLLVNMLKKQIPELNLTDTGHILSCELCHKSLQVLLRFLVYCFDVEEKICYNVSDDKGQIDLKEIPVLKSTIQQEGGCRNAVENEGKCDENQKLIVIKSEPDLGYEDENDLVILKSEEINIKSEGEDSDGYNEDKKQHVLNQKDPLKVTMVKCESRFQTKNLTNVRHHRHTSKRDECSNSYKCNDCAFETVYRRNMRRHLLIHKDPSGIIIYKCEMCIYETRRKESLKRHKWIHTRKLYKCKDCAFKTIYQGHIKRHKLSHDPNGRKTYKCNDCSYETTLLVNINQHKLIHKGVVMHKCNICTYETKRKVNLQRHMLTHKNRSDRKTYKCKDPSYETTHRGNMKQHTLIQESSSDVIMHKCEICTYETKRILRLQRHMLSHKNRPENIQM